MNINIIVWITANTIIKDFINDIFGFVKLLYSMTYNINAEKKIKGEIVAQPLEGAKKRLSKGINNMPVINRYLDTINLT